MKQFYLFLSLILFFISIPQQANAQLWKKFQKHVEKKVGNEASKRINKQADKVIEKSFDKVEGEVEKRISGDSQAEQTSNGKEGDSRNTSSNNEVSEARGHSKIFDSLDGEAIAKQGDIIADPEVWRVVHLSSANKNIIAKPGDVILYKTTEGNFGKLELINVDRHNNDKTTFRYVTYNSDGSVKSQSDNFSVRGTYTFDLDNGTEEGTSSDEVDFQIQREDEQNTKLTPYTDKTSLIEYKKLNSSKTKKVVKKSGSPTPEGYKLYPFKSGIIEYKYEGSSKGSHVKYIDDYGYKQADYVDTETRIFGMTNKQKSTVIQIGPKVYTVDYKTNSINVGENKMYKTYMSSNDEDSSELGERAMSDLGFEYTGQDKEIFGKTCKIYKGSLGEIWAWNNLPLKSKTRILGLKVNETVTKLDIDVSIPNSKFEVPNNMEINDTSNYDDIEVTNETLPKDYDGSKLSDEEKIEIKRISKMSYSEFKDKIKKEDPKATEDEMKQAYEMAKEIAKRLK